MARELRDARTVVEILHDKARVLAGILEENFSDSEFRMEDVNGGNNECPYGQGVFDYLVGMGLVVEKGRGRYELAKPKIGFDDAEQRQLFSFGGYGGL